MNTYDIQIQQVSSHPIAVVRRRAKLADLKIVVPEACGAVWSVIRAAKTAGAGRHVAVYLDEQINLEVGVEVSSPFPGQGEVLASTTPAGTVATAVHIGPYHLLLQAHQAIRKWCAEHNRPLAGPNWEIYGHWTDDQSKLRTDVYYLLK